MKMVVAGAVAIALGTWLGAPTLSPVLVGLAIGFAWPLRAARVAAAGGLIAWGGLLLAAQLRGDAVARLSSTLGAAMGLPGWALFVATLLYPAVLASSAAWLASLVTPRRTRSVEPGATLGSSPT
jgi:hypothetical protein